VRQDNFIANQIFLWGDRATHRRNSIAFALIALIAFCSAPGVKSSWAKFALMATSTALGAVSLQSSKRHYFADQMATGLDRAALDGWRQQVIKTLQPVDSRSQSEPAQPDDEDTSEWDSLIAIQDPLAKAILLGLMQLGVNVDGDSLISIEENDRGWGYLISLPPNTRPTRIVNMAEDLMAIASLPSVPIIQPAKGGVSIILRKPEVQISANHAAPSVTIPKSDAVAVESDEPIAQSNKLPDGAILVEMTALNDIDRYPVMMVVAGQGSGKTATMGSILASLDGHKAVASPKPMSPTMQGIADLIFGFDPAGKRWLYFGSHDSTDYSDDRDLSHHLSKGKLAGSMLDFLWACRRESMNRQLEEGRDRTPWRCFFDEASYTYLSGFNDPMSNGKLEKEAQLFISGVNKDAFMNFRGQGVQMFFGAQSKSVESIGLKNFAAARDEAWFLFPGIAAITEAKSLGKHQLAQWMQRRVEAGYGVALLNKQDAIFEVINLPDMATLQAISKKQ
jgi:hypothetical protein